MKKKRTCKKISKITLAVTLVASAVVPVSASLKSINANTTLTNQSREIQKATGSITPVKNEFVGDAKKKIFSSAHFKVACTEAFTEIRLNDQKLGLVPNKWSDISLNNVKKWLKEGEMNKIEILFTDDIGELYVGGTYEFIYDITIPTAQITYSTIEPTRNNVVATLVISEDVNEEELMKLGWIKTADRTFNKEYASNVEETLNIYDLAGNASSITVKITNIDKKIPKYKPENWFITVEVDANAINRYLTSEQVAKILESQKQYITDDNVVSVVEDKWWNQNSSKLDIRKIGNYANSFSFYITDAAGNRINPRLSVKVVDTIGPKIDLGDTEPITTHELNSPFVDINPTAVDNSGENIPVILNKVIYAPTQAELETSTEFLTEVDVSRLGWYKLEYKAEDSSGNIAYTSRIVQVIDTTAPEYKLDYSKTNPTYDSVTVTITTNEQAAITGEGWKTDSTGMIFTKVFMKNSSEYVVLTDLAGNAVTVNINVENIVNTDLLEKFVTKCKELDQSKYTEASWKVYYPVYEAAVEMLETPHPQDEIDQMYENLIRAYLSLRLIPNIDITAPECKVDYSSIAPTYDSVTVTITTNEQAVITGEGWKTDSTGMIFTKVFKTNDSEDVVLTDLAGNAVTVNIKVENIVNKNLLERFVNKCKNLDESKYTEASWKVYYPVYEAAVEMLQTPHVQTEVDQMYKDLVTAYLNLRLIPNLNLVDTLAK